MRGPFRLGWGRVDHDVSLDGLSCAIGCPRSIGRQRPRHRQVSGIRCPTIGIGRCTAEMPRRPGCGDVMPEPVHSLARSVAGGGEVALF
jgi:hypothetical protein